MPVDDCGDRKPEEAHDRNFIFYGCVAVSERTSLVRAILFSGPNFILNKRKYDEIPSSIIKN